MALADHAQQIVLQDYIHAVQDTEARLDRLTRQIEELLPSWSMAPVVTALQGMRGVAPVAAATVVAEVGDFRRFANARQLMTQRLCENDPIRARDSARSDSYQRRSFWCAKRMLRKLCATSHPPASFQRTRRRNMLIGYARVSTEDQNLDL